LEKEKKGKKKGKEKRKEADKKEKDTAPSMPDN